jgi:VWFA-related protein
VTVTPKLVQVVVTDEKGNPATGIRKDEFVLYDNGEEKKITEFERHSLSIPAPSPPADKRVETTPVLTNPLLNRKFLFLFDFVFAEGKGFRIGKEATLRFIESNLASADEAGIISFSGARNLCVHQFFTKDHLAVRKAIESLSIQNLLQVALVNTEES